MRNQKKFRGLGIAAVGYLMAALSAALMVTALKIGLFAELPRWAYSLPMLLGLAGAIGGFVIGAGGIVITWASFGNNEVKLDWIIAKANLLHRWWPDVLFKWSAACALASAILGVVAFLKMDSALPLFGTSLLAAAAFAYLGIVSKLWWFLARELSRSV